MSDYPMSIDGRQVDSAEHMDVINPATAQSFSSSPVCTTEQLEVAIGSAGRAFAEWRGSEAHRREMLDAVGDAIGDHVEELADLLTTEQGKPLREARSEVQRAGERFKYWAELDLDLSQFADASRGLATRVALQPLGVVAVITPWNYPVGMSVSRMAPALFAGNTVVLKPSPFSPLTVLRLGAIMSDVLPDGVVNVVSGTDDLGRWMSQHPKVRAISFTGSIATGKKVAESAAPDLKRAVLELGGNDPAIILDDVDPVIAAEQIVSRAFSNCGQICYAIKRVYVPDKMYRDVVDAFATRAAKIVVGDGHEEATEMGPINNAPQLTRVEELVAEAIEAGAHPAQGGERVPGPGYFFQPTILANCDDGMRIVDEEQFGPALPVVPYSSVDDAIERGNRTMFGLGASVWSNDTEKAQEIAFRLNAASVWVNTHGVVGFGQPHTGSGWSGLGITGGTWLGLVGVTDLKVVGTQPGVML